MTSSIRAIVKFQRPFLGSEKEIKLKTSTVTVDDNTANYQIVEFTNEYLFPFTVAVPQTANWVSAYSATTDNMTPPNIIRIAPREKNPTLASRESVINVTSDIGKEVPIKVVQAGGESWITVDGYYGEIYLSGNSQNVSIKSNAPWTAISNADWCTVSPNSGKENGTITVSATANPTGTYRNAMITLTSQDNKAKVELNVIQSASSLSVSKSSISFSEPASQNTFTVISNASWTATSDRDWCTVNTNGNTVTVSVTENLTGVNRNATVTVAISEELKTTVSITQAKATLSTSKTNISLAGIQSGDTFTVTSNISTWAVNSNQTWCTATRNNNTVSISVTENLSGAARTASVKVALSEQHFIDVTVTQAMPTLSVSVTELNFPKTPTNQGTITVTSNVSSWNVVSNQSWCTVSKSGNVVTVLATPNSTGVVREAYITISLPNNTKIITIRQGAFEVGDYYNVGGVRGVVYRMDANYVNGMIISLDETQTTWGVTDLTTSATSSTDGLFNMTRIKLINNWDALYPAFAWCDAKNTGAITGWYLPAIKELSEIYTVSGLIDVTLYNNGGMSFKPESWSSTEYRTNDAYRGLIQCSYGHCELISSTQSKSNSFYVRAIKAF